MILMYMHKNAVSHYCNLALTINSTMKPYNHGLTHWGRVTHICVSEIPNIGSDNSLSPGRRQAIIWTNVGIVLIRTLRTNFVEILREIHTFSFKKMHLNMSSGKRWPFCLGLNVLRTQKCISNHPTHWIVAKSDPQDSGQIKKKEHRQTNNAGPLLCEYSPLNLYHGTFYATYTKPKIYIHHIWPSCS